MIKKLKRIWAALTSRVYTKKEVMTLLDVILRDTYDKDAVDDMIAEIDKFDAGAVDEPRRRHIYAHLKKLALGDDKSNKELLDRWNTYLDEM